MAANAFGFLVAIRSCAPFGGCRSCRRFDPLDASYFHAGRNNVANKHRQGKVSLAKHVRDFLRVSTLALACCAGKHFKDAVLVVRKAGEKPVEYLKMLCAVVSLVSAGHLVACQLILLFCSCSLSLCSSQGCTA
jgi:hypothetical protein